MVDIGNYLDTSNATLQSILKICWVLLWQFYHGIYDGHLFITKDKQLLECIQDKALEGDLFGYPTCCIDNYIERIRQHWADDPLIDQTFTEEKMRTCPLVKSVYHDGGLSMHHVCSDACEPSMIKNEKILVEVCRRFPNLL